MKTYFPPLLASSWLLFGIGIAHATSVLAPTSQSTAVPSGATETSGGNLFSKSLLEAAQGSSLPLAKWGPVAVRPHLLYRVLHADGLLNPQQSEDQTSVIQTVSPGLLFEIGDAWTLDYTYSRTLYSNRFFRDEVEHGASMTGAFRRQNWSITGVQRYSRNAPNLVETGQQTPQENYMAEVDLSIQLGDRTRLDTLGSLGMRKVNEITANPLWTTSDWSSWEATESLRYEIGTHFDVGAGFNFGYDSIKPGSDMAHTQPQARLNWYPSNRLVVSAVAGVETRKFESGRGGHMDNPVYRTTLRYALFTTTKISVAGTRSFSASYFANWATRTLGWNAGLEQRLLKRFFLNVDYGEQDTKYVFTSSLLNLGRADTVRTLGARLGTTFLGAGSISLIYQNGKNSSTEHGFSFNSHQWGAEFTYHF